MCYSISLALVAVFCLVAVSGLSAAELGSPRKGIVQGVPLAAPWNGCLLVREGPDTTSRILGHVINGTTVMIEGTEGAWYKISAPMSGYVYGTYVKIVESDPNAPANPAQAITLEEIVIRADPWDRETGIRERRKLLEDNDTSPPPELPTRP